MLPVAPRGHRAASQLAERALEGVDCRTRAPPARWRDPGRACCGSARSARRAVARLAACSKKARTWTGIGHPRRVAERDLLAARVGQALRDLEHALLGHLALVGAAERDRDHALAAQARCAGPRDDLLQPRERLLDRAVDVLAVVRLARREEQVDLVEQPLARLLLDRERRARALSRSGSAPCRRRRRRARSSAAPARRRRAAGSRRAARTRSPRAGCSPVRERQSISAHLVGGVDDLGLVLEAVARADLADANVFREVHLG